MRSAVIRVLGLVSAMVMAPLCTGIYLGSMKWLKVKWVDVPSDKVDLKILLITDLHSNSKNKMNLDIWKRVRELEFDMAVITGDVIINLFEELTPHIEDLRALAQRVPVFFVEGNHEIMYKDEMRNLCAELGIKALYNEKITCKIGENILNIIGVRDNYVMKSKKYEGFEKIFGRVDGRKFNLVLSHQPQVFDRVRKIGYELDLMLSGHTHGGQLRLPFLPTLYAPGQGVFPKYGCGLYQEEGKFLYVSRGIGTTIFPIRFYNRPELAVIHIHKF